MTKEKVAVHEAETMRMSAPSTCPHCAHHADAGFDGEGSFAPVYALGHIELRIPTLGVEKELAQAIGRSENGGLTDAMAVYEALRQHRYLARSVCFVLLIGGLETYILRPADGADLDLLVEAVRPTRNTGDMDAVIGVRGPLASPAMCNGLTVPIVIFEQLYSFDVDELRRSIPRPAGVDEEAFFDTADEVLSRITVGDNAGATDADRALNYLALRYEKIYSATMEAHDRDESLSAIEVRPAMQNGTRRQVDVILSYTGRRTDVTQRFSVRVDVTETFPHLVTPLYPYIDRIS